MKILFVFEHFYPNIGGAETLSLDLSTGLAKRGDDCWVVTSRLPGTPKRELFEGIEIYRVSVPPFARRYWFTVCGIWRVWRLAKQCDIIQTSTYNAAIPAWLVAKARGKKCVITVYEVYGALWNRLPGMSWLRAWPYRVFERLVIKRRFDRFVAISQATQKSLVAAGVQENKTSVIYPVVDYDRFDPAKTCRNEIRRKLGLKNEFMYMFFGRPGLAKGGEFLVRAVPEILKEIPDAKLLLILSSSPRGRYNRIRKLIINLGIEGQVIWLEPVAREDLPSYIAAADCVVVPSFSEGFGYTAVEAATLGVPTVIADAGSLPEVIFGDFTMITPGDPSSIAHGVIRVSRKETTHHPKRMFQRGKAIDAYLKLYRQVLHE